MTALPQPTMDATAEPRRWSAGRIVALRPRNPACCCPGLGLPGRRGALLWVDGSSRNGQTGSCTRRRTSFDHAGLRHSAVERIDLATGANWLPVVGRVPGKAQIRCHRGQRVPPSSSASRRWTAAAAYLAGVARTRSSPTWGRFGSGSGTLVPGGAPAGPPGAQTFWVSQASGAGSQHARPGRRRRATGRWS